MIIKITQLKQYIQRFNYQSRLVLSSLLVSSLLIVSCSAPTVLIPETETIEIIKPRATLNYRVFPYLQNPTQTAMTILWLSDLPEDGFLTFQKTTDSKPIRINSSAALLTALNYPEWESQKFFAGKAPTPPYQQRVRIEGLEAGTLYQYSVSQGGEIFTSSFKTAPDENTSIRVSVYADSETEPESTGKFVKWDEPFANSSNKKNDEKRRYLIDQTKGYANNLEVIQSRKPDLILIAGDLVQSGGEQRDWDEFWMHNNSGTTKLASTTPIMPAIGNHEYYAGPKLGHSSQPASEIAFLKYLDYFEFPANNAPIKEHEERYYSFKYGPATFIMLDLSNNTPEDSSQDTSFYLNGSFNSEDNNGLTGFSPGFEPDSTQVSWLKQQLEEARSNSQFTFIVFHHAPYSSGPHGQPPGFDSGQNPQSGVPVRALTHIFMEYGVDAVLSGHDEMWERSVVKGERKTMSGDAVAHTIHFYDVGIGGDGLRKPQKGVINQYQTFVANDHAAEQWVNGELISGGRHYGHLEMDINRDEAGNWQAELTPVYILPTKDESGIYNNYIRKTYDDVVVISKPAKQ